MFKIDYKIITDQLEEIEQISDEEIHYDFFLGNVSLLSPDATIEMDWEWIPLLDFAYCMQRIVDNLKTNSIAKECFEFTENAETLDFLRKSEQLKIVGSFTSKTIETTFADFEKAIHDFHFSISAYIRRNKSSDPPTILQKYLSV